MSTSTFDAVSGAYARTARVQQAAADRLMDLLRFRQNDDVLDVACGPGHITRELRGRVRGRVVGVDASAGMVAQARKTYPAIEFQPIAAEQMRYDAQFDRVFCNSALQWFAQPDAAVRNMHRALRSGGRAGIACPGTAVWSPCLSRTIEAVAARPEIAPLFARWRTPWFFLPSAEEYPRFFEAAGFATECFKVDHELTWFSVEEAYGVYLSGAANGFTDPARYDTALPDGYVAAFNAAVKEEFIRTAVEGRVPMDFNRIYYVGTKA